YAYLSPMDRLDITALAYDRAWSLFRLRPFNLRIDALRTFRFPDRSIGDRPYIS
ncbi:MAG: hypothetical protein RLZZ527_752, partial [Actinomycetota bacterium]